MWLKMCSFPFLCWLVSVKLHEYMSVWLDRVWTLISNSFSLSSLTDPASCSQAFKTTATIISASLISLSNQKSFLMKPSSSVLYQPQQRVCVRVCLCRLSVSLIQFISRKLKEEKKNLLCQPAKKNIEPYRENKAFVKNSNSLYLLKRWHSFLYSALIIHFPRLCMPGLVIAWITKPIILAGKKQWLIKEIDTETFPHKYIQYRTHLGNSLESSVWIPSHRDKSNQVESTRADRINFTGMSLEGKLKWWTKWNTARQYSVSLPDTISLLLIAKYQFNHSHIHWAEGSCSLLYA